MTISVLSMSAIMALSSDIALSPPLAEYSAQITSWVLEGRDLDEDYRTQLLQMSPADRLGAIILLRRAGLMTGEPWSLQDILNEPDAAAQEIE